MQHNIKGFTLLELMVTLLIVGIMTAIALPSYQTYVRKNNTSVAQQEMLRLAEQLERHRARNLSYKNFNPSFLYDRVPANTVLNDVYVPGGVQTADSKYKIEIRDTSTSTVGQLTANNAVGYSWALKAYPVDTTDEKSEKLLITSAGTKCKNTVLSRISYTSCGAGAVEW